MVKRFRMIAGPNGSGKSTLVARLRDEYAVNFYDFLNADDILSAVRRDGAYLPHFPVDQSELAAYAESSGYGDSVRCVFRQSEICVDGDCVRFQPHAVNSYTIALLTNFLQDAAIRRGLSFSQETVFSHPSKVEALKRAAAAGYRTYLYFVATESPQINVGRVANRKSQGGHDVPPEKVIARYARSLAQVKEALPFLSRAYFFDNSASEMTYLGQYSKESGFLLEDAFSKRPNWFRRLGIDERHVG